MPADFEHVSSSAWTENDWWRSERRDDRKLTMLHAGMKSEGFRSGSEESEAQIEAIGFHQQPNQHPGTTEHRKMLENFDLRGRCRKSAGNSSSLVKEPRKSRKRPR
jgi:hypothetical protein